VRADGAGFWVDRNRRELHKRYSVLLGRVKKKAVPFLLKLVWINTSTTYTLDSSDIASNPFNKEFA